MTIENSESTRVTCISDHDECDPKSCDNLHTCDPDVCHNGDTNPNPIIAANEYGYITGDPHLRGGDGEYFDLNPKSGKTFNALSDRNLSYDVVFGSVGQGTGVVKSIVTVTSCCDGSKSEITFDKYGNAILKNTDAYGAVTTTNIDKSQVYTLADGGTVKYGYRLGGGTNGQEYELRLVIDTHEGYEITQVARDRSYGDYIDSNIQTGACGVYSDGTMPSGIIGHTFDADTIPGVAVDDQGTGVLPNPLSFYQDSNGIIVSNLQSKYLDYRCCSTVGTTGSDVFYGKKKRHEMWGGDGDDLYVVCDKRNNVSEDESLGNDSVISSISYRLGENLENLRFSGKGNLKGYGNDLDNLLIGNNGKNVLDGGDGFDTLIGGKGNDIYYVDENSDDVLENVKEGTDTVISSIDYTLGANVENLTLINDAVYATGNELNNVIIGNSLDNVINGGAGKDVLKGGAGDDTYKFTAGDGIDVIDDKYGNNKIVFDSDVSEETIAFKYKGKDLIIDYGTSAGQNSVTIKNAAKQPGFEIELSSSGNSLTVNEINGIIKDMTSFAKAEHISISTMSRIKDNEDIMTLVSNSWNQ